MEEPKRIPVKIISQKGDSALVEWDYHRAYIPVKAIHDGEVSQSVLNKGIPYGVKWEKYITITVTPESIANDLRRCGVWCLADLKKPVLDQVSRAFDLGEFIRRVHKEEK